MRGYSVARVLRIAKRSHANSEEPLLLFKGLFMICNCAVVWSRRVIVWKITMWEQTQLAAYGIFGIRRGTPRSSDADPSAAQTPRNHFSFLRVCFWFVRLFGGLLGYCLKNNNVRANVINGALPATRMCLCCIILTKTANWLHKKLIPRHAGSLLVATELFANENWNRENRARRKEEKVKPGLEP